jgi:hypothetical protein
MSTSGEGMAAAARVPAAAAVLRGRNAACEHQRGKTGQH